MDYTAFFPVLKHIYEGVRQKMAKKSSKDNKIEWDTDLEILLFYAMLGLKPVGVNRHFAMMSIHNRFTKFLNYELSSKELWDHLDTMYHMPALHDSEILPFPNKEVDFELPEDCHELLFTKYGVSLKDFKSEKTSKTEITSKTDKISKTEKISKIKKKTSKTEKTSKTKRTSKSEKNSKTGKTSKSEKNSKTGKTSKSDKTSKSTLSLKSSKNHGTHKFRQRSSPVTATKSSTGSFTPAPSKTHKRHSSIKACMTHSGLKLKKDSYVTVEVTKLKPSTQLYGDKYSKLESPSVSKEESPSVSKEEYPAPSLIATKSSTGSSTPAPSKTHKRHSSIKARMTHAGLKLKKDSYVTVEVTKLKPSTQLYGDEYSTLESPSVIKEESPAPSRTATKSSTGLSTPAPSKTHKSHLSIKTRKTYAGFNLKKDSNVTVEATKLKPSTQLYGDKYSKLESPTIIKEKSPAPSEIHKSHSSMKACFTSAGMNCKKDCNVTVEATKLMPSPQLYGDEYFELESPSDIKEESSNLRESLLKYCDPAILKKSLKNRYDPLIYKKSLELGYDFTNVRKPLKVESATESSMLEKHIKTKGNNSGSERVKTEAAVSYQKKIKDYSRKGKVTPTIDNTYSYKEAENANFMKKRKKSNDTPSLKQTKSDFRSSSHLYKGQKLGTPPSVGSRKSSPVVKSEIESSEKPSLMKSDEFVKRITAADSAKKTTTTDSAEKVGVTAKQR